MQSFKRIICISARTLQSIAQNLKVYLIKMSSKLERRTHQYHPLRVSVTHQLLSKVELGLHKTEMKWKRKKSNHEKYLIFETNNIISLRIISL